MKSKSKQFLIMFECEDNLSSGYHDMFLNKYSVSRTIFFPVFFFSRSNPYDTITEHSPRYVTVIVIFFLLIIVLVYSFG